jgi:hypothetical protein
MSLNNGLESSELTRQLVADVRKELSGQVAKWLLVTIVALVAAALIGWWAVLLPELKKIFGGAPIGSVVAFDLESCPNDDWAIFEAGKGKFLVAADGKTFSYRIPGGRPQVTLTGPNMPPITIAVPVFRSSEAALTENGGYAFDRFIGGEGKGASGSFRTLTLTSEGTPEAFDTLPPFLPLTLCEKVR